MGFTVRRATEQDVEGAFAVMEAVVASLAQKDWYKPDDRDFIHQHITEKGFTMVAEDENGKVSAFFVVHYPRMGPDNLGRVLDLTEEELLTVAHMESAAVLPSCRGHKLQARMLEAAEAELAGGPFHYLMVTVHPDNVYSLGNMLRHGYQVVATMKKYGGLDRHILCKQI